MNLLIVPFCSHAGKPNFRQLLEQNGGDDETRTRDLCLVLKKAILSHLWVGRIGSEHAGSCIGQRL